MLRKNKKQDKPLFKFELQIGVKTQTIAVRNGDDPKKLADSFIRLMQVNREQYYDFVVAKIQESVAIYQMQQDEKVQ